MTGLGQTIHIEEDQGMGKIIEVGQDMILIERVIPETIWEVIRSMGDKIITKTERGTLGSKAMKEIGVGHMIGTTEAITEGTIEALVIVGLDQVQEQVWIEIGLDVLHAENMTIFQETVQLRKQTVR